MVPWYLLFVFLLNLNAAPDQKSESNCPFNLHQLEEELTSELARNLTASTQAHPVLILLAGPSGAGKTTLANAVRQSNDLNIISFDAIRQALLDRRLKGSPFDSDIIHDVYQKLFNICLQKQSHILFDTNTYHSKIEEIESLLDKEQRKQLYHEIKIYLNPSTEVMFERVRAREHKEGVHQGTEEDLKDSLTMESRKIIAEDYDLILDTGALSLEAELKIVNALIASSSR